MPRKGAAETAPAAPAVEPTETPTEAAAIWDSVAKDKPARPKRGGRKPPTEQPPLADAAAEEKIVEDWTRPAYADDPGEFEFDMLSDADEWYSVLHFGPEGTGKTTNVAMVTRIVPEGRVLFINAEAGAKRRPLEHHGVDVSRIATYPKQGQQLTFEGLERLFYRIQADLAKDPKAWAAVVWDSITAIYQKLLDDVIEADIRKQAEILQRAGKGRAGRSGNITLRDRFDTDRDDYAAMSNQVRLLLRKYRTLHCHLLITALERKDEVGKGADKHPEYGPAISPALSVDLLGYMDVVLQTRVTNEGVYVGRSQPTETSRGKDRLNALPIELVDPTIERIHQYVIGELSEDTDPAQRQLPDREVRLRRRSLAEGYAEVPTVNAQGAPDEERGEEKPAPKQGGRRTARSSEPVAASPEPDASAGEPSGSGPESPPDPGEEVPVDPPKTGGRKPRSTGADAATKAEAVQDGVVDKTPPKRGGRKAGTKPPAPPKSRAEQASGFVDEPPF